MIFRLIFVSSLKFVDYSMLDVSTTFMLKSSLRLIECRRFERRYRDGLEVSRSRRSVAVLRHTTSVLHLPVSCHVCSIERCYAAAMLAVREHVALIGRCNIL